MNKTLLVVLVLAAFAAVAFGQAPLPAGINPANCPHYPYCNTNVHAPFRYPAGINSYNCPGYPYC